GALPRPSVQLDLHVDARRKLELHQRVDGLVRRVDDVHQPLVSQQLVLIAGVLIDVRRDQHGVPLDLGRQGDRPADRGAGPLGRIDDLASRLVDQAMIESLQANPNVLIGRHVPYSMTLDTTPAPTVRPPSRIAKRRPSSIAIGAISSTFIRMLSPGITVSVPSGSSIAPVTSVVRK